MRWCFLPCLRPSEKEPSALAVCPREEPTSTGVAVQLGRGLESWGRSVRSSLGAEFKV